MPVDKSEICRFVLMNCVPCIYNELPARFSICFRLAPETPPEALMNTLIESRNIRRNSCGRRIDSSKRSEREDE